MKWEFLLTVYVQLAAASLVGFAAATVLAAVLVRLRIGEVDLFLGPSLISGSVGGVPVRLRLLPYSVSIRFVDISNVHEYRQVHHRFKRLDQLSPCQQVLVALAGPCGLFLLAAVALDCSSLLHHCILAVPQIYLGAIQPFSVGQDLLSRFAAVSNTSPFEAMGILSAKMAAANLLPLPGFPGFSVILAIASMLTSRSVRPLSFHNIPGLLVLLPIVIPPVGWTLAMGWFVFTGR